MTAAGFGAGSALTVIPIQGMIASGGYETAFLHFGLGQGIVVCAISWFLRAPRAGEVDAPSSLMVQPGGRQYTPIEMVRSPGFWIMYALFVLVGSGGLMATAQLAPIASLSAWHIDASDMAEINRILRDTITDPVGPEFMAPPDELAA